MPACAGRRSGRRKSRVRKQIRLKLRDEVAGVTQCLIKIEMLAAADQRAVGLDSLKITTLTQLNRRTLPKLALGGNQIMLWADEQLETTEVWPPLHDGAYKQTAAQEDDAWSDKTPDGFYTATLGSGVNGKECSVTWKLEVPSEIHDVFYSVVSTNRTEQSYVSLRHSWDGKRFTEFDHDASGGFPMDKQVNHTIAGRHPQAFRPAGAREASSAASSSASRAPRPTTRRVSRTCSSASTTRPADPDRVPRSSSRSR